MDNLSFLPAPRRVERLPGSFALPATALILLQASQPSELFFTAGRVQEALRTHSGAKWEIVAGEKTPAHMAGLTLRLASGFATPWEGPEGYRLAVRQDGLVVEATTAAGLFRGACTLVQLLEQVGRSLPCVEIVDWPDFPARGVMLDISRDKVPTMATLYRLVDMLASWKINQVQLYTEHTFAYRNHPEVWATSSPMTGEEILALDAFCRDRFIELVPNQNSFGHLARWLRLPRYEPLAELCGDIETPWGIFRGPFSLCATDPASLDFLGSLYDELLPHFASRQFNVGCDETWDLGQGRSREACLAAGGAPPVYLDFLLKIQQQVHARGHVMQFWADIAIEHPELLPPALHDSIAMEWGYEANHPFAQHSAQLAEVGIPFYVCPGTGSWCTIAGRTDNALANLKSAAREGLAHGAIGYLNTDWGDYGHWQALPVSYLGFAAGAANSWAVDANRDLDIARALSVHAFRDPTGNLGRAAYDLGNVYRSLGIEPHNGSVLFHVLKMPFDKFRGHKRYGKLGRAVFECASEAIEEAAAPLSAAHPAMPDADLIRFEFGNTVRLLRHATRRGLLCADGNGSTAERQALDADMQEFIACYEDAWLARNRPGGLPDSVARLQKVRADYVG